MTVWCETKATCDLAWVNERFRAVLGDSSAVNSDGVLRGRSGIGGPGLWCWFRRLGDARDLCSMERKTVLNTDEQSGSRGYGNPDREHDRSRAMGSALAKALLATDLGVTVWNRSSDKSDALAAEGAAVAESISEAVDCSEVIVVCVRGYDVANDLFRDEGVAALLAGKGAAFGPESAGRPVQPASQDAFSGSVSHDGPPARWWVAAKRLTGEGRTFRRNKSVEITGAEAGTGAAALDG